mgnify:CR=1 FL=1
MMVETRDIIWLLGVPIDRLSLPDAVDKIIAFSNNDRAKHGPRLVATVNADFLANALPWFGSVVRHPELVRILRRADMCTADGMPLLWMARFLGSPLPDRVTGADLVPALARAAADKGKSIYLFGGIPEIARQAAEKMRKDNPGLNIAGVHSPFINTKGVELADAYEKDQALCEKINRCEPDILLIAFGNPKQELWFARNRHRLKAGAAIGIGGTFDFITGRRLRAPLWMRKTGVEWLFRMLQDPRRLGRRYAVDAGKLMSGFATAGACHAIGKIRDFCQSKPEKAGQPTRIMLQFHSGQHTVRLLNLFPDSLQNNPADYLEEIQQCEDCEAVFFNCKYLSNLNSKQIGSLMVAWETAAARPYPLFLVNIKFAFKRLLKSNRAWDMLAPYACRTPAEAVTRLAGIWPETRGFIALERHPRYLEMRLLGMLEAIDVAHVNKTALAKLFAQQPFLVNFELCTVLDSTGIGFLVQIYQECKSRKVPFCITGISPNLRAMFRAAGLHNILNIFSDVNKAHAFLQF